MESTFWEFLQLILGAVLVRLAHKPPDVPGLVGRLMRLGIGLSGVGLVLGAGAGLLDRAAGLRASLWVLGAGLALIWSAVLYALYLRTRLKGTP